MILVEHGWILGVFLQQIRRFYSDFYVSVIEEKSSKGADFATVGFELV